MKRSKVRHLFILLAGVCLLWMSCQENEQPILGADVPDPNPSGEDPASITGIDPPEGFLKDVVTITGNGFDPTPEFNVVNFANLVGTVLEASATELTVETPNLQDTIVQVRVAIKGSELWSNQMQFTFKPTLAIIDDDIAWANGIELDADGNVYYGSVSDEAVYMMTPDGTKSMFASVPGLSGAMHFGPGGWLYVCTNWNGNLMRVSADGSTVEEYVAIGGANDCDWDADGNMYIAMNGYGIAVRDAGGNVTEPATDIGAVKNVRVFGDHIYVSKIWDGVISRFPLNGGALGAEEIYMDATGDGFSPSSFEFDIEGTMYWSHAWDNNLYTVNPDGMPGETLYEGELVDGAGSPLRYMQFYGRSIYMAFPGWAGTGTAMSAYIGVDQAPRYGKM